ncbi:MAG: DNA polymerase III subunit alpha [Flavobacteriales bacterium]|nr:DNA polymerase III subunit alpha [Flavobacteriales bacterium]
MYLIFDTETTGLPKNYNAPLTDADNWPRLVQLAWQLHDTEGRLLEAGNVIVRPDGFDIPFNSEKIHGISTAKALAEGIPLQDVLDGFSLVMQKAAFIAGHNIEFDINIMGAEYLRLQDTEPVTAMRAIDTKEDGTAFCAIPGGKGGKFKWPKLTELHIKLFNEAFDEAHNAAADVAATSRCFLEMIRIGVIPQAKAGMTEEAFRQFALANPEPFKAEDVEVGTQVADSKKGRDEGRGTEDKGTPQPETLNVKPETAHAFAHLHCHTQFSVLQSTIQVKALVEQAFKLGMPGVAVTDHANMYGIYHFVDAVEAVNGRIRSENARIEAGEAIGVEREEFKGVVGCEFYLTDDRHDRTRQHNGHQTVLLAKDKAAYHNLAKLSSVSFSEGFYYVARIDREVLLQYKEGLIATTGGLGGEVPNLILNVGEKQAEEAFLWWKEQFGDDFYVELIDHGLPEERKLNQVLIGFAKRHGVKYFPANNVYYLNQDDAKAQKILQCVKEGVRINEPSRGLEYIDRQFPNDQFYFRDQKEMKALFAEVPEAFATITEIMGKVENFKLKQDVLLPKFDIPEEFLEAAGAERGSKQGEMAYLTHLAYEGAKKRYTEITDEIRERIDFELGVIDFTGYPGYFLIVQDFCAEARNMGVSVGPGRGSAAGSVVAYCIGITNVDPIKYDLLFERFLNPDRVSLPDIDIDFDDEGRGKVIDWVVKKYGKNQVAQIITYGSMAAKSAIRDTARVMNLPLSDADRIAKLIPDLITLAQIFSSDEKKLKEVLNGDGEKLQMIAELKKLAEGNDTMAQVIQQARVLEGSLRNTGVHACGVIITPSDITGHVPVTTAKDSDLSLTQFDNSVVENAGLLKMDFLGLKTLSIIKDAILLVKQRHNIDIDPDTIPLDDAKTYELYQKGHTNGTFQFESAGMQKHLRNLMPDKFGDLIAMNALYRPGPIEYIPDFIARKLGREPVVYDLPEMEGYLAETYGITVYQEQVMLLSQKLADFTKGMADKLRKAMGKKIRKDLDELKPKFLKGAMEKGHPQDKLEKIWTDWEAFAQYAFNKSHSTCYSVVAYHTGYLKSNYPAEYMASVLTHNMNDLKKVTFFMDECRRMGVPVLGPDINESRYKFAVNAKGEVRFGLGAVKGVGEGAVEAIVNEREANGPYISIFDLSKRIDLRAANKKALESLAVAGAFDSFAGSHRAMYFHNDGTTTFLEKAIKYGQSHQESINSAQVSLFGDESSVQLAEPTAPVCEPWGNIQALKAEREVVGVYISGHPLDEHKLAIATWCNSNLTHVQTPEAQNIPTEWKFAGIVTGVQHRMSKNGNPFGIFELEDHEGTLEIRLFGEDYTKWREFFSDGFFLYVRAVWKERWRGKDDARPPEKELKMVGIELLPSLMDKKVQGITIDLPLSEVLPQQVAELETLFSAHPGPCKVAFRITDQEGDRVILRSRSVTVKPDQELIYGIQEQMGYKVGLK